MNSIGVRPSNPCPICGRGDWCLIAQDGSVAICARTQSERPAGMKGAGWLHRLGDNPTPRPLPPTRQDVPQAPLADANTRNQVYGALLDSLSLSSTHRENLYRRGLSDEETTRLGYRSLPLGEHRVLADHLLRQGLTLSGIPGFYVEDGIPKLAGASGMLILVKDLAGMTVGLQVRCDAHAVTGKYKWLSSARHPFGCSPGCPVHVAQPPENTRPDELWLTEGALKADIASLRLGRTILAVAGVGLWPNAVPIIRTLKPSRVVVAFDADKNTNPAVHLHHSQLIHWLLQAGIHTYDANWDSSLGKGLDDVLVKGTVRNV